MAIRSWLEVKAQGNVLQAFEALLPLAWNFMEAHQESGELRWQLPLSKGFAVDLAVHPSNASGTGFAFQTKIYLVSSKLATFEKEASFADCQPSSSVVANPRGILASIYVEGLVRVLHGGAINLLVWEPNSGLNDPQRWRCLVDESIGILGEVMNDISRLPQRLLDLDLLSYRASPSPIVLFANPFVLAAEVAILLDDPHAAVQYLQAGERQSWSQHGDKNVGGLAKIAVCKARKLAALINLPDLGETFLGGHV